ncbi:MAG: PIG-L family deacetylase [Alphaproteobacteria bacterium]|nr:MAG: PIG-L family deacetylase [Alphaproteobacteria bacterium]
MHKPPQTTGSMRKALLIALLLLAALPAFGLPGPCPLPCAAAQERPSRDGKQDGWATLQRALPAHPRTLFVGAHPDDETAVAGLLTWLAARGRLWMVSLTAGENLDTRARAPQPSSGRPRGGYHAPWGDPPARRGSALGRRRAAVFRMVAKVLGAERAIIGPFVNGPLPLAELDARAGTAPYRDWVNEPPERVLAKWGRDVGSDAGAPARHLARLIRSLRPHLVVSFDGWCGGSGHPEHLAAALALRQAVALAADPMKTPARASGRSIPAWKTPLWITSAFIAPALAACGYCKCRGEPPEGAVLTLALDTAGREGSSPLSPRVGKCLALIHYAVASRRGGIAAAQEPRLQRLCHGRALAQTPEEEQVRLIRLE